MLLYKWINEQKIKKKRKKQKLRQKQIKTKHDCKENTLFPSIDVITFYPCNGKE